MAKQYKRTSKPIDIRRKTPVDKPKKRSPEALSLMQKLQHQRIGNYARLQDKINAINHLIKTKRASKAASIIRYWLKYSEETDEDGRRRY